MTPYESPVQARDSAGPGSDLSHLVREELVRLLFRFSLVGYLATLLVVFILGAILWDELARPLLFAWFIVISAVTVGRYVLYKVFVNRSPPAAELPAWERRFLVGVVLTAILWALIGTTLLPEATQLSYRLSVAMLVSLVVTTALGYCAPHPYAFKIEAFVALVPLALWLGFSGDRQQAFLSGAILLLAGTLPIIHERLHRALVDSLTVHREKTELSTELVNERTRLQQANESLATEMVGRLKAQQSELVAAQMLRLHVERTPLAVIEWDRAHRVTAWNPAAEAIFGYRAADAIGRTAIELIVPPAQVASLEAMWAELADTRDGNKITLNNVTRGGSAIHCEWYNTPLVDSGGRLLGFASLVQDVTERLNTERTIHYMAHHDALTGLPNRRLMQDRLNQAIMQARRKQHHVAVLFLDLDRFKLVNDTLGHDIGDTVLKEAARRLSGCVREIDTVSREGGDEFVVVLPDLERPESARLVADKIVREFAKPIEVSGQEVHITTSIGISHFPNDATDVNHLLKHADSAMYQAKDAGRNTVRFFTSDLNFLLAKRFEVEGKLRRAIDNEEFFLCYQPQVDFATGRIIGMEALLRWNDPLRGEIFPKDFISVAEEVGLIVQLGEWVFRTACRQARVWEELGATDTVVSVNISPRQFMSRKLVASLLAILRETGANPRRVVLEITETMIIRNVEQSIEILEQLRSVGMGVAIDDFGVGYSSLGQLKRLPVTGLKVDGSFIANLQEDPASGTIAEAIIAMARRLKLHVTAEGVETRQQLEFLRGCQCDAFQGYIFSRAVTSLEATAMLRAQFAAISPDGRAAASG